MFRPHGKHGAVFIGIFIICIVMRSYIVPLISVRHPKHLFPQVQLRNVSSKEDTEEPKVDLNKTNKQVDKFFSFIEQKIVDVPFVAFNKTSSAVKSLATILTPLTNLCIGDTLVVRVDMFNWLGEKKTWGGDFIQAHIYSPGLGAGASGRVEDFNNGSYNVYFTLFWEGSVDLSIVLHHPSEGVALLWRNRKPGHESVDFFGHFLNDTKEAETSCVPDSNPGKEMCEFKDRKYGEVFYCFKPPGFPCADSSILQVSYILIEGSSPKLESRCQTGTPLPFPSGYFLKKQWHPVSCSPNLSESLSDAGKCLSGKLIYLFGDSTLRQWIEHFPKILPALKFFDLHGVGKHQTFLALDLVSNLYIQWKKHGHPFVSMIPYSVKDHGYVANEIDRLAGGEDTIIAITLSHHFRYFPLQIFIRRLLNVRRAIERLFLRSPDTKVIIKTGNSVELVFDVERTSDFHGYVQYLLTKEIFSGLNVGLVDAWDMNLASGSYNVHPVEYIIHNQIRMFLSYIC
ncbi:NXPE family member 1-like [Gastrophryne carolinensis]